MHHDAPSAVRPEPDSLLVDIAEYVSNYAIESAEAFATARLCLMDSIACMFLALEIQGVLAWEIPFNRVGVDHVILVRVATPAVATHLLGGTKQQIINALSNAWIDGGALRTYRHAPNAGPRKSWAAGDATSRAVRLAFMTMQGEPGLASPLSAPRWGFADVSFGGKKPRLSCPLGSYVMENVRFKIAFPA